MPNPVVVTRIQNRRGTQTQFDSLYPAGYTGIGGFSGSFNITTFPGVLVSGEIALCTDSRRIFMGNINGEYIEVGAATASDLVLSPFVVSLPPQASFTTIPTLTYAASPFMKILYDVTDTASSDWNAVGTTFSRNGQLEITAVTSFAPISNLPFPPTVPVNLTDTGTEINLSLPASISFIAQYDVTLSLIEILYTHDFAGSLTLSSSSIKWISF